MLLCGVDHVGQVVAHGIEGQAAQGIVTTDFDDDDVRVCSGEKGFQSGACIGGGVATDAGIDETVGWFRAGEALLQPVHPPLFDLHSVSGANAVADHEYVVCVSVT